MNARGEPRGARGVRGVRIDPEQLVYGRHPIRELLIGPRRVEQLWATQNAARDLATEIAEAGVDVATCLPGDLDELTGTADHQGIAAQATHFQYREIDDLIARARKAERPPFVLCLDQITDPHNLGAIARVCDAVGADGLLVPRHRSASVTGAVCKASAGAIEHVAVARCTNLADTLTRVIGGDLWAYGASERGVRSYTDVDWTDGALLVLGSEGDGIRPRVQSACDELVRVPMQGQVSSLNVATVAAIMSFEVLRQRTAVERS